MGGRTHVDHQRVIEYLLRQGLLSPRAVLEGEVAVVDASRRHRNSMVLGGRSGAFFVKYADDGERRASLAHENRVYEHLNAVGNRDLRELLPRVHVFDQRVGFLVLELFVGARVPGSRSARTHGMSRSQATLLGRALGWSHSPKVLPRQAESNRGPFRGAAPWILSIHEPSVSRLREISSGNASLIKVLQASKEGIGPHLEELRTAWRPSAVVHNDLRWDNCLVLPPDHAFRLRIVDWEFADIGDPAWDVGSIFACFLQSWLLSPRTIAAARGASVDHEAPQVAWPATAAFWTAYRSARQLDEIAAQRALLSAMRYAGARLLQIAFEHTQQANALGGAALSCIQLASNVLRRPGAAAAHLLGLR